MPRASARFVGLVRAAVAAHGGGVAQTLGGQVLAAFVHPPAAVAAALDAQRALAAEPWALPEPPLARMAIHTGDLERAEDGYTGIALNHAARLLAAAGGGQVLLSLAAEELARDRLPQGAALADLGSHRLVGIGRPERIFQLAAPGLPAPFPPPAASARHDNLPAPPTPLVGREAETATICGLLRDGAHRLVTLTGPGGVGKTRLAISAAGCAAAAFADGVCFIDLSPVREPALVATVLAHGLGVQERGSRPLWELLKEDLRERQLLLVIDNFEQVLDAAPLVAELLAAGPGVKALVTSRAPLNLRGEHEVRVEPLALADPAQLPAHGTLSQYAAVALLIERAADARPGFEVTSATAPALAEICVRLDGLPLAIELAAARMKQFAPQALLARLEENVRGASLAVLVGGPRDLPARQQTLRDTIAWSYNLLAAEEQRLFRCLGIFPGGCTSAAAAALCPEQADPAGALAALVGSSLLREAPGRSGAPRYVMLQTIREYALERLESGGELEAVGRRHALLLLAMAEETARALFWGHRDDGREEAQADEIDNLRAALAWAIAHPDEPEIHLRLGCALKDFWWYRGLLSESRIWRASLLAMPDPPDAALMARALTLAGDMAWGQGEYEQARALAHRGLDLAESAREPWVEALASSVVGKAVGAEGDFHGAVAALERSLAGFRALDDPTGTAWALVYLGEYTRCVGDLDRAGAYLQEAYERFAALDNGGGMDIASIELCELAIERGELNRAALLIHFAPDAARTPEVAASPARADELQARAAQALAEGVWLDYFYGPLFRLMGRVAQERGARAQALTFYRAHLEDFLKVRIHVDYALDSLEGLAVLQSPPERGARLLGAAARLREQRHIPISPRWRTTCDRAAASLREALGDEAWERQRRAGAALSLDEAVTEALQQPP